MEGDAGADVSAEAADVLSPLATKSSGVDVPNGDADAGYGFFLVICVRGLYHDHSL